ncbi:MAG TPA: trypsin-like peptidase domain-containing protein [Trebonia sp.]
MSEPFAQYPSGQYPIPEPPRKPRGRHALGLTATAVVALAVGAGAGVALSQGSSPSGSATAASKTVLSTTQIANRVDPALVDVTSTLGYQNATAKGTGIVLTSNGEILTNNHVVSGATSVSVTDIGNGKTYKATVTGYDESKDIAVLQLSGASGLTTATTGDSSGVGVGDKVVALGNAGGVGGTPSVAPGQVTALNQSITASDESAGTSENLTGMIETNANIQSGDSGGSLVNQYGQVIGVDTAASSSFQMGGNGGSGLGNGFGDNGSSNSSGSGQGSSTQGFSIPINTALSIASQIEGGHASSTVHIGQTAFLGLEISASSGQAGSGVMLAGAAPGTAAANAGLTEGDTVTSVAGQQVNSSTDIQHTLIGYHPGDKISIGWTDVDGQSHTATVTLTSGPVA